MSWSEDGLMRTAGPGGNTTYTCKECRFVTSSQVNASCHVRVCHSRLPASANYSCDSCGFRTNDEDSLRVHSLVRHAVRLNKTYQCSECSFSSVDKMALMHHVHSNHYIAGCSSRKWFTLRYLCSLTKYSLSQSFFGINRTICPKDAFNVNISLAWGVQRDIIEIISVNNRLFKQRNIISWIRIPFYETQLN